MPTHSFLKGALHQWSYVLPIDTMSSDSHQVTTATHDVTQQSQVPIVDVGTIKRDDVIELLLHCLPHCLNA